MRGLSVALVEAGVRAGTSSRSSKMVHGGLRLAQGDLALVTQAASERKTLEVIAPRLAVLTPFVLPARNAAALARLRDGLCSYYKLGAVAGPAAQFGRWPNWPGASRRCRPRGWPGRRSIRNISPTTPA